MVELQRTDVAPLGAIVSKATLLGPQRRLDDPHLVAAAARVWWASTIRAFLFDLTLWDARCRRLGVRTATADAQAVAAYVRAISGQDLGSAAALIDWALREMALRRSG